MGHDVRPLMMARRVVSSLVESGWSQILLWVTVAAVVIVTITARLSGLNPPSLRPDDLIYGAVAKTDFLSLLTAPIHVAPGVLAALRVLYSVLPDPEWSLQMLPFACGLAAVPVMAGLVWRVTREGSLAALAAAATALNPLLAYYTVFVRQYPLDFLVTALLLFAAVPVFGSDRRVDGPRFTRMAAWGGLAVFVSVTSVFMSASVVAVGAGIALWREFRARTEETRSPETIRILASAAAYVGCVLAAYLLLHNRSNDLIREYWVNGFMTLDPEGAWTFLVRNVGSLLERSLPIWESAARHVPLVSPVDPDARAMQTASWPLPLMGLGLLWLLWRRETREVGLVIVVFYTACVAASALQIYPVGAGRPDIFAFPAGICLFAAGVHRVTGLLSWSRALRLGAAGVAVAFSLIRPIETPYSWPTYDRPLVDSLAGTVGPDDGIILSHGAGFLAAFYGRWPVVVEKTDLVSYGAEAGIVREKTLLLPFSRAQERAVAEFLAEVDAKRVWYLAYSTLMGRAGVLDTLEEKGFLVGVVEDNRTGTLYLASRGGGD